MASLPTRETKVRYWYSSARVGSQTQTSLRLYSTQPWTWSCWFLSLFTAIFSKNLYGPDWVLVTSNPSGLLEPLARTIWKRERVSGTGNKRTRQGHFPREAKEFIQDQVGQEDVFMVFSLRLPSNPSSYDLPTIGRSSNRDICGHMCQVFERTTHVAIWANSVQLSSITPSLTHHFSTYVVRHKDTQPPPFPFSLSLMTVEHGRSPDEHIWVHQPSVHGIKLWEWIWWLLLVFRDRNR